MLKIKDNVDLKILEKYGFDDYNDTCYVNHLYQSEDYNDVVLEILVFKRDTKYAKKNTIQLFINIFKENINYVDDLLELDVMFDLIKEGLVEKVVESNG